MAADAQGDQWALGQAERAHAGQGPTEGHPRRADQRSKVVVKMNVRGSITRKVCGWPLG